MTNVSLLQTIPENANFIQPTKFTFVIPNLPFARYFCQTVTMPGVSTGESLVSTPFADTYRHGDKLMYEGLNITFLIDEDLRVWEETYKWLVAITKPQSFAQYRKVNGQEIDAYYDGTLTINTNANIPNIRMSFIGCFPTSLTGIDFSTTDDANNVPTASLSLRYQYFEILRDT